MSAACSAPTRKQRVRTVDSSYRLINMPTSGRNNGPKADQTETNSPDQLATASMIAAHPFDTHKPTANGTPYTARTMPIHIKA